MCAPPVLAVQLFDTLVSCFGVQERRLELLCSSVCFKLFCICQSQSALSRGGLERTHWGACTPAFPAGHAAHPAHTHLSCHDTCDQPLPRSLLSHCCRLGHSFFLCFLFCQRFALCDGVVLAVGSASHCPSTNVELCLLVGPRSLWPLGRASTHPASCGPSSRLLESEVSE